MANTDLTINELRNLSDELIDLRRAILLGREELKARGEISQNEYEGMGRTWVLVNDLFEVVKNRAFAVITSDLSNVTSRLRDSMRKAEIVIASAQNAVNTLKLAVGVFNLIDGLLLAIQEDRPAEIAEFINEIDSLANPTEGTILPDSPITSVLPPPPILVPTAAEPAPTQPTRSDIGKIIQDVDISKQFYYELTPRRLAILDLIAYAEGTDREIGNTKKGYNIIFTFKTFSDFSDHPRRNVCSGSLCSTAAGRYQFLNFTWDGIQRNLQNAGFQPFPNFGPQYQDQAALYLIDAKRKSIKDVDNGDLTGFLDKCSWEWASLPIPGTSPSKGRYPQPVVKETRLREIFNQLFDLWNA